MCRLLGLHGGETPVRATFWLLDAPASLVEQSRRNPDGYGIATFETDGSVDIDKGELAAFEDERFASEARSECSTVYVAHVRYASTGPVAYENAHPFDMHGRVFAHNGVVQGLDTIDAELRPEIAGLIRGQTDSERLFALVTQHIADQDGDVDAGLRSGLRWAAEHIPIFAMNVLLGTPTDLWALRYPEHNPLWLLDRRPPCRGLDATADETGQRIRSDELQDRWAVLVASERLDDDPHWREVEPGELVHVGPGLDVTTELLFEGPPAHQLTLEDLSGRAAASQAHQAS
jgi:glutamine amidotransferase